MAKSKLTLRQRKRIRDKQSLASSIPKNDDALEQLLSSGQFGPEQTGIVVTRFSNQADVMSSLQPGSPLRRCYFRSHLESLVTGDRVVWRDGDPDGVISAVLPRTSQLERPDSQGNIRTVVANIDHILIVVAADPEPHNELIDRYLVASEHHQIAPIIILNKCDLDSERVAQVATMLTLYRDLDYPVVMVSAHTGEGIDELKALLTDRTSVFVGQSGVGKSSIINTLCPPANAKIGKLSTARAKGRHTTTTADLYLLSDGGSIIDSPGIREFGLVHLDQQQLARGFIEFRAYLGQCRFRNCSHKDDPDCALRNACEDGKISAQRLDSYHRISASLGYV